MSDIKRVLIVGGGAAGWLAACHLAKRLNPARPGGVQVTLVESDRIPTIGVGEGTVPAIRQSLRYLGISETEFIRECDGAFKQSIQFIDWLRPGSAYHHVFDYPATSEVDLTPYWLMGCAGDGDGGRAYADAVSIQGYLCDRGLAPKTMTHPEFEGAASYAYHLDAAGFTRLLTKHGTTRLGVRHLLANVRDVRLSATGDIKSVLTDSQGELQADFFVDCTGFASELLGRRLRIPFIEKKHILFADSALAAQVPYAGAEPIACHTLASAREAGWIWDIALSSRRGIGYVYSSGHTSHDRAERVLRDYLHATTAAPLWPQLENLSVRRIPMRVGYRQKFWHKNCVAIGLSQGFVEPLEATGLLVYDATARMLAEQFPTDKSSMALIARRFNQRVGYTWDRVIDFIKLHYFLSRREDSDFWHDNRDPASAPRGLLDNLALWRHQVPSPYDFSSRLEIFNLENYLYVLYGMDFQTDIEAISYRYGESDKARRVFQRVRRAAEQASSQLLPHRALIERIKKFGLQKI